MMHLVMVAALVVALLWPHPAAAQTGEYDFQIGLQFEGAVSSEFDSTDIGVGGRISWHPTSFLGAEAQLDLFPSGFPDGGVAFSRRRVEGLFGVTLGPHFGGIRPFAKVRPGFVTFSEASEPIACILIFPPPLSCTLASGATVFALDVGGGVELSVGNRTFVRLDAGDRLVRYPGPALDSDRQAREDAFFSHDFRFAIGGGVRF
jgi:hypothetical protein